jgi:hypothetical protein
MSDISIQNERVPRMPPAVAPARGRRPSLQGP